ncbi:PhzF family phenazine biosynthesis protein, partial [Shewanella sp. SG41-4]|uniref:PhzF family phenazine biosynthesis protein n=1 Tax=Shewanella sp. SG41-4 TaxID=2760976 RepID=UPI0016040A85
MELDIFIVDVFTKQRFKGNSAAVIPLDNWLDPVMMQQIATQNSFSETAFIKALTENRYEIRWFSPITEIDFCGHATLASSFVIFNHFGYQGEIEFLTLEVGTLVVNQLSDGRIEMSFPNQCPDPVIDVPPALLEGLSYEPVHVLRNRQAYFAVMSSEYEVMSINYNAERLKLLAPFDVVVTAQAQAKDYDFISRYFWPAPGGDEDPVTGSIHSGLAPYWAEQLSQCILVGYQPSKRSGIVFCKLVCNSVLVTGL